VRSFRAMPNLDIQTPDGVADAYLASPDDGRRHPGVLFMMDGIGLRPRIEEMADRIAAHGYTVLAPNAFYRGGRAPVVPIPDWSGETARAEFFEQLGPLMQQLTPERAASDGRAYLDELAEHADAPFAVVGYCMGVRLSLWIAGDQPDRIDALAGFHGGGLVTDEAGSPHRSAANLRAEAYFGHAENDRANSPEQIAALDAALDDAGVPHRSEVYEGAPHGYTMSDTPMYDEAGAERHFTELLALLDRTIGRAAAAQ
jgi:carboxymethylenebutenolidase